MTEELKKKEVPPLRIRFEELKLLVRGFLSIPERMAASEEMLEIARKVDDGAYLAYAFRSMAMTYCIRTEYDKGIEYFQKAYVAYETAGVPDQACYTLTQLAVAYHFSGEILKSLEVSVRAIAWARELADTATLSQALINAAESCMYIADFERGIAYLKEALQIARVEGKNGYVAQTLVGLSEFALAQGDPGSALAYAREALEEKDSRPWAQWKAMNLRQVAKSLSVLGRFEEALPYFAEALETYAHAGDVREQSLVHQLWGGTLRKMNDLDAAQSHITQAIVLAKQSPSERLAAALMEQGEILAVQGNISAAVATFEEALTLATGNLTSDIHESMSKVFESNGDIREALNHFRKANELKQKYVNERVKLQLQFVEMERGFERERRDIELIKGQLEKELSHTTLHLLAQTELLSDLRADLLKIARKIPATEPAARELRERVKRLPCESIDWEKFDTQFKAAHPDFVHKLMEAVPDLSPMEIRISTLIRMNLKSEEIARLFCVTERAVEFHRLNIRKKMGLKTKDNLSLVLAKM